jgi:membrane protein DedA with SNARE-associated domain
VRTLVSVPAGIERMPQGPFLAWTTAGSLVWTLLLTLAGKVLGQGYGRVQGWFAPWAQGIERGLVVALVAGMGIGIVRLLWQRRRAG